MMLKLTLTNGETLYVRQSAVLSVYRWCLGVNWVTYVQVGHMIHEVKETPEEIMRYFEV